MRMKLLTIIFLKIFIRNRRAIFFVILLPVGIFLAATFLGLEGIVRFQKQIRYNDFLLTGVIAFAMMQTGIYTATYTFIDYHKSQVLKRLSVTPLSAGKLLTAQVVARFFVAVLQAVALLLIGVLAFHTKLNPALILLPVALFIGNTLFLNIGFLLSSFTRDYEQAAPYTTVIGMVSMFLGDVFFPIENLPGYLARVAEFLPMAPLVSLLRFSILGAVPEHYTRDMVLLLVWFVGLSLLAKRVFAKKAYR